ncbi:YetF domain-containing protein [Oceanobacillus sp. 1P07AA]|uniref:YetF domain-containing protein n=1 Tax=Oceanobacillus sp. 1P07AA TaxID=3132293 RepID=UPI0039A5FFFF
MGGYFSMFFEMIIGFIALFLVTKILGKTQISQITPFDFIAALLLGELVGNALFDQNAGIIDILFVIAIYAVIMYISEIISQKYKHTRHMLEGFPSIVIYNGKLIRDTMKKNKLDINQLQHLLRTKDTFSIQEVEFAVLEANGTLSVLKKSDYQMPTRKDLKLSATEVDLSTTLINDGEVIVDNLKEKNLSIEWLTDQIKEQGYERIEEVFYAEYIKDKPLFLLPYVNRNHQRWEVD